MIGMILTVHAFSDDGATHCIIAGGTFKDPLIHR